MVPMRLEKLRKVDLNLLIIFAVIAEEKSVTKASARLLLSQPAVSRALQRARWMFQDELVVRSPSGFELTLRGRKILQELEQVLPKIEGLVVPSVFDPKKERSSFRISGPDNVCIALLPPLPALASAAVNFWFTCRSNDSSLKGRVWRKVPDDTLSYLGVGLNLSARRLPPPVLRPRFVALSSDFVEGTFIPFPRINCMKASIFFVT
jgi:hypothetical protein